jgi:hypothetical protein
VGFPVSFFALFQSGGARPGEGPKASQKAWRGARGFASLSPWETKRVIFRFAIITPSRDAFLELAFISLPNGVPVGLPFKKLYFGVFKESLIPFAKEF